MTSPSDARRAKALELHLAGVSYDAIAQAVGYASKSGAHKAVQQALKRLGQPADAAEVVDTEIARLDAMLRGLWPAARRGDVTAVDRVLRIEERRTQILARGCADADTEGEPANRTGLSDFEKRLRERETGAEAAGRADSG